MNYDHELIEVHNMDSDRCMPVFCAVQGDYEEAILIAAKLDRAEIIISDSWDDSGVCVFSDDSSVMSGRWWALQVYNLRRFLGKI